MTTNNLGFRNNRDTREQLPANTIRILIAGDSHIDGVMYNKENVASHLSKLLKQNFSEIEFEVINGGVGYYNLQHYIGFLHKFGYLQPQIFVLVIYTGNDFGGAITYAEQKKEIQIPPRTKKYMDTLNGAFSMSPRSLGPIAQGLNQIYFLKHYPKMKEKALELGKQTITKINNYCNLNKISLIVALLPTKNDIEPHLDAEQFEKTRLALNLSKKDLSINRKLSLSLKEWLVQNSIETIDLADIMKDSTQEYFWKGDYHINNIGHKRMADAFFEKLKKFPILDINR